MGKGTWSLAVVLVALGVCMVVMLAGGSSASHAEAGSGDQSPEEFCGITVEVEPIPRRPVERSPVQIRASGVWYDSCVPRYESYLREGDLFQVYASAIYTPPVACLTVITPWEFTVDVGSLAAGSYRAVLYIRTDPEKPSACAKTAFEVSTNPLITAVYYDTYPRAEPDEAVRLMNAGEVPVDLVNWTMTDDEGTVALRERLAPGASVWIAREARAFAREFGFAPDYEYHGATDPTVPDLRMTGDLNLANDGDQLLLKDSRGLVVDSVVYEDASTAGTGWSGETIAPYDGGGLGVPGFDHEGQILYRKLDQATGRPIPDTDTAADWAQATDDPIEGKKVQYPGWDLQRYFFPATFTETARVTYAVAPDHLYETVLGAIKRARSSLVYEGYAFENAHLADALVAQMEARPEMAVTVLLEGDPEGGISNQEKWICQQIEKAGGQVYFMVDSGDQIDAEYGWHDRYANLHGSWMVIDRHWLLTGSEDLTYRSMPADDKSDGTEGRRGVWLITDAPSAVARALDVFRHDWDPAHHRDLVRWTAGNPVYGAPPPGFVPDYGSGGTGYAVRFPVPLTLRGTFWFEVLQSPESSLRDIDSLLGLVGRAGRGDTVLVEQLYEPVTWGSPASEQGTDPNPRLEAYVAAARRGARVRLLLDSPDGRAGISAGNAATCIYADRRAAAEGLDLACKLADPSGGGLHNKMVLVQAGGRGYVHTGSIDGSELSSKGNREMAVQVQSDEGYAYLSRLFWSDWGRHRVYLPIAVGE